MDASEVNDVNLSEVLFKPKHDYIETSLISNSGCELPVLSNGKFLQGSAFRSLWYRPLDLYTWTYLGGNYLDIDEALANIAISKNKRTRPQCFDTVEQYGPGNWIYEFSAIAQKRYLKGVECDKAGDKEQASHQFRMASRYFAIAAFPNLNGDVLSAQAQLLGRKSYRLIFNDLNEHGYYSEETFKVRGEKVTGYLHSVNNTQLQPCVIVVANYLTTSTDFYRLFSDHLRKSGIAIFVIDLPGLGSASNIKLDEKVSDVLEAAVEHLKNNVRFIDGSAIGALGNRLSTTPIARLCIVRPDLLKACVMVSPTLHNLFINQDLLNNMPLSSRSSLANRMGLDASSWETIVPQMQILSLKKQGLITYSTKSRTPTMSILTPTDLGRPNDADIVESLFTDHTMVKFKQMRVSEYMPMIFDKTHEFFKEKLL